MRDANRKSASGVWVAVVVAVVLLGSLSILLRAPNGDPPGPAPALEAEATGAIVIRMLDDMTFEPAHPVVRPGQQVVWVNEGNLPHTATNVPGRAANPDNNTLPEGAQSWDSGLLPAGERYETTLTTPGEYTYLCTLHEAMGMVAKLTVAR